MYIVCEGIDTSGKTTQIQALQKVFPKAIFTKEPGGTQIGQKIRTMILEEDIVNKAEFFLFLADRAQHYETIIKPNLHRLIISDRSLISGIAYANYKEAKNINIFCAQAIFPDICFVFDMQKEELKHRLQAKQKDKIEERGIQYLLDIQKKIIKTAKEISKKTIIINAQDTIQSITQIITKEIRSHL